jgi:electron transport complex protein RnfG
MEGMEPEDKKPNQEEKAAVAAGASAAGAEKAEEAAAASSAGAKSGAANAGSAPRAAEAKAGTDQKAGAAKGAAAQKAAAASDKKDSKAGGDDKSPLDRKEHPMLRAICAGLSLAFISAACCFIVIKAGNATDPIIERNESAAIAKTVNLLLPKEAMEGAQFKCRVVSDKRIGSKMRLYTSEKNGEVAGYVMTYSTNRGYSVPLVLIAGFTADKKVYKADIFISHETPGLGDKVDRAHGDFLDMMNGKGLEANWDVRKFGGDFDYITGSTVTSRAVVTATGDALAVLNDISLQDLKPCRRR